MAHSVFIRNKAKTLRRKGCSLKEISEELGVVKSTVAVWVQNVAMSKTAEIRLLAKIKRGQFVSARNRRAKTKALEKGYFQEALEEIRSNPNHEKIMCAMLYWCEGGKNPKDIAFTNSDPHLVKTFLNLLRRSFSLDEKKFHPCIHLHSYHSLKKQLDFWSKITDIDIQQFMKPYRKPNGGKRLRENYQGCICIRYYSSDLARRLIAIAKAFLYCTGV
jgi:transcriptional regulator with XRE-family HTH domain